MQYILNRMQIRIAEEQDQAQLLKYDRHIRPDRLSHCIHSGLVYTLCDGNQIVEAEVPMAEMSTYAIDLRAMTQARGSFTLEFARYEEVPKQNQAKIIEEAKNEDE
jgi:translation elongation factor EF-G